MIENKQLQILMLGDPGVGKTALLHKFVKNEFKDNYKPTIAVDFLMKYKVAVSYYLYDLQIWHPSGDEKYNSFKVVFYRLAEVVILAYSVDNQKSFDNIKFWYDRAKTEIQNEISFVLVAMKSDLDERVITQEQGLALAKELGATYQDCSAKTPTNVSEVFIAAVRAHQQQQLQKYDETAVTKLQSFFRGKNARAEYRIKKIENMAQEIITHLMKAGKFIQARPLFDAICDKKWDEAFQIMEGLFKHLDKVADKSKVTLNNDTNAEEADALEVDTSKFGI